MNTLTVRGVVFSGKGEGAKYVKLPWVKKQIIRNFGFDPYAGTLNIRVAENDRAGLAAALEETKPVKILPEKDYAGGKCYLAGLKGIVAHMCIAVVVVIPELPQYPTDVIELVAPVNLREKLHLRDNDVVNVTIML